MSSTRFSPSSWTDGARSVDALAKEFATTAQQTIGGFSGAGDLGGFGGTSADQAVGTIVQSLNAAALRTIAGLAEGLSMEADTMAMTGRAYENVEQSNQAIAQKVGQ